MSPMPCDSCKPPAGTSAEPSLLPQCHLSNAFVLFAFGRWDDAFAEIQAALAAHDAQSAEDLTVAVIHCHGIIGDLGAVCLVQQSESRLRALGVRRGTHGRRPRRPAAGWESLTESEHRVALLVAEGLSNPVIAARLFVSRRTVEYHVSNILAKLGLTGRVELAAVVARLH